MSDYGLPIVDNPALGIFFGHERKSPLMGDNSPIILPLMLSPGQFSSHKLDAFVHRVCKFARSNKVFAVGGTEGHNMAPQLHAVAPHYGFSVHVSGPSDGWILTNRETGEVRDTGYVPAIPADHHSAAAGGHNPRGIDWVTIVPKDQRIAGLVAVGVSHWVTKGQDPNTLRGKQNLDLERAIGKWCQEHGTSTNIAFHMGDTNLDDKHRNAYTGVPVTSCWDELGRWPVTHPHPNGGGPTLDLIASYDRDSRTKCRSARALDDNLLPLPVDHFSVYAEYAITPRKANK